MGVGYNTLDLTMLLIAALVIWAASRIPVKEEGTKRHRRPARPKAKNHPTHSVS